jgi:signal transduction histidine kinase
VILEERTGLAGMRERFTAQGGTITLAPSPMGGIRLTLWLPAAAGAAR